MTIDTRTVMSPGWQLARCYKKLTDRQPRLKDLFDRYDGRPPRDMGQTSEAFQKFWKKARTNFAEMIVRAARTRMTISAIQTAAQTGPMGDEEAWRLFTAAELDVISADVHRVMLTAGDSYVIGGRHEGQLAITAEDPRQCVTMHDPVRQSIVRYGAKFFHDDDESRDYAYLYTPTGRWVAYRERRAAGGQIQFSSNWDWDESRGGEAGERHNYGMTPIIRFRNEEGVGEFERHIDLLDRIDHYTMQGMVIATMQAFKQRALMVDDADMPDVDPVTGQKIDWAEILTSAPDRIWKLPATAQLWESGAVDLTPIFTGNDKNIQTLSAVSFTPLSMFSPDGQNQSAEGASLHREGLVTKVSDRINRAGHGWARVMALMFAIEGDGVRADPSKITIDWMPVERYGLNEKYAAATSSVTAGVPWRTRMTKVLQFTPAEVDRMEAEREADLQFDARATQAKTPPAPAAPPTGPDRQGPAAPDEGTTPNDQAAA